MSLNSEDIALIERYFEGRLPDEELPAFHERLEEDDFREYFVFRKHIRSFMHQATELERTREFVGRVIKKEHASRNLLIRYSVAATFLILIGLGGLLHFESRSSRQDSLFSENKNSVIVDSGYQIQERSPDKVGKLYIKPYSLNDTINLSFPATNQSAQQLFIINSISHDTVINVVIQPAQHQYLISPGRLTPGKYRWLLKGTTSQGSFRISGTEDKTLIK